MNENKISRVDSPDLAIIGMAGRFPRAKDIHDFWRNLRDGVECVSYLSDEDLISCGQDPDLIRDPQFIRAAAVLDDIEMFDASFFSMLPREAEIMDPQQRIFLECSWEALEDAGYDPLHFDGAIGVYAGTNLSTYLLCNLYSYPRFGEHFNTLQVMLGNDKDFVTTHVAYKLNLRGPCVTIQTACSTSLVAVHTACQALLNRECDMALAGGVSVRVRQKEGYRYQDGGILSPDGHCRAYDAAAKGTIVGNGAGVVVLKRLKDAITERDHVYAVVKGSAVNNDGALKMGFTAPGLESQSEVVVEALANAGVEARTINYIEGHGTGTSLGDPIEVEALTRAFRSSTNETGFCALGSVKTNIGHLDAAAGVAGLIKTVLALNHRMIPPSLHFHVPNQQIDFTNSPFYVNTKLVPWVCNGTVRRAGVSSFGLGGTNAHVILEEAPASPAVTLGRPWSLVVLSARTPTALESMKQRLAERLKVKSESLADVAYTLQSGRRAFQYRWATVSVTCTDTRESLMGERQAGVFTGHVQKAGATPVTFLFSGKELGLTDRIRGKELYEQEASFRSAVERCVEAVAPALRDVLRKEVIGSSSIVEQAELSELGTFTWEYALAQLWDRWGVRAEALMGEGVGEYVAATQAGVFQVEEALQALQWRASDNHRAFSDLMLQNPRCPYISSVTGRWITPAEATDSEFWAQLESSPNRLETALQCVLAGCRGVLVEVGPGHRLTTRIRALAAEMGSSLAMTPSLENGKSLYHVLAQLWVQGVQIDWQSYAADEQRKRVALPTYPFERERYWIEPSSASPKSSVVQRESLQDWFYLPSWKRMPRLSRRKVSQLGWLLFIDSCGVGEALAAELIRANQTVMCVEIGKTFRKVNSGHYQLRPACREDYDQLVSVIQDLAWRPQKLVHMWSVTKEAELLDANELQERSFYSLLYLAQALKDQYWGCPLELSMISTGVHDVTGGEVVHPEKAMGLGPCKVIPQENSGLRCRNVDIKLSVNGDLIPQELMEMLVEELSGPPDEPVVAFRGEYRWVQTFEPIRLEPNTTTLTPLRMHGVYLITGGFGGLGLALAEYLARTAQAKLILTGRTSLPPRSEWHSWLASQDMSNAVSIRIRAVQQLEELGAEVLDVSADVTNLQQMQMAIAEGYRRFGVIHGVIHAAALKRAEATQLLIDATSDMCEHIFRPKVGGLRVLEQLLTSHPLDFCIMMSSVASILGGYGLTAYTAANLFLDAVVYGQDREST
ncbi:MAG: KR domain-containing protein, partial [Bryobacteraceae bacterium]|nr:KR domain-containing protein [Bryobacteraceae bacterium]